ncbi:TetR/AcrR family transcriptional regulator [Streptomyces sp. H10-C2]|uniref:TetR/AcrR family transcriptional regulator n=1 Tax=unclassified Streptomyces TaxID=2593676 RepID=UPI0024B968AA|nr:MULTISPECIES: TetR/AcrR family transcriptional regulator [unclassified Streptomyces]MDJ0347373.1 TetR/AcrR family transcriptional regulator [Streptomyces sp. PH10-H1]MDJ0375616.1 TetR/AcrR family transcriptional regulator [Streptomyces sp. H10-C2]
MPVNARQRLLTTAEDLFYAEGIRAVGLERILSTSGVGRASFYRHFASKDELVVAVLQGRDERWRAWLADRVTALGGGPLAVFDALAERFARQDFRGCAFINTMIENADPASPAHRVAAQHKTAVAVYVETLLTTAGAPEPAALAAQFTLLMDGATVTALRERTAAPAARARAVAAALLASAVGPGAEGVTGAVSGGSGSR